MSLFKYSEGKEQKKGYATQAWETKVEKQEVVKKYNLVDCFSIKEIARSIIKEKSGSEDELSDEMCEAIATGCFQNLSQVIEKGQLFMRHARRSKFTVQDFKMGFKWAGNPAMVSNLPTRFRTEEKKVHPI